MNFLTSILNYDLFANKPSSKKQSIKPSHLETYVISTIPTTDAKVTDPVYYQKTVQKKKYIEENVVDDFIDLIQTCYRKPKPINNPSSFPFCFRSTKSYETDQYGQDMASFDYKSFYNVCKKETLSVKKQLKNNNIYVFKKHPNFTHHFLYDYCMKDNVNFHGLFILIDIRKTVINGYMLKVIRENLLNSAKRYNKDGEWKQIPLIFVKVDMFRREHKIAVPFHCNYDFDYKKTFNKTNLGKNSFTELNSDNYINCYTDEELSKLLQFDQLRKEYRYVYMLNKCYIHHDHKESEERNKSNLKEIMYKFITL